MIGYLLLAAAVVLVLFLVPLRGRYVGCGVDCIVWPVQRVGSGLAPSCLEAEVQLCVHSTVCICQLLVGVSRGLELFRSIPGISPAAAAGECFPPIGQSLLRKGNTPGFCRGFCQAEESGGCVHASAPGRMRL